MPLINTIGVAASRAFGFLAKIGKFSFFDYFNTGYSADNSVIAIDESNNIYNFINIVYVGPILIKTNTSGVIQFQEQINATYVSYVRNIKYKNSYLYCLATMGDSGTDYGAPTIFKINTGGGINFQRSVKGNSGHWSMNFTDVIIDSSNNSYICGKTQYATGTGAYLVKYNSSGTIQWQYILGSGNTNKSEGFSSIVLDTSESYFYCSGGAIAVVGSPAVGLIAKFNSSGTIQWQRFLTGSNTVEFITAVSDSSNNQFAFAYVNNGSYYEPYLVKYNSSGTIQWQKKYSIGREFFPYQAVIDSSGNMYLTGTATNASSIKDAFVMKIDSTGAILWQKKLGTTVNITSSRIALTTTGAVCLSCSVNSTFVFNIIVENSGSVNGSLTANGYTFTYADLSASTTSGSLTDSAGNLNVYTSSNTDYAGTSTFSTPSPLVTSTVV